MRQICSGGVYGKDGSVEHLHDLKLQWLKGLHSELQGKKILCFYNFRFEKEKILEFFSTRGKPHRRIGFLDRETKDITKLIQKWGAGRFDYLFCQIQSTSHGIDGLQQECFDIAWLTLPDDLALYQQGNGRVVGPRAQGHIRVHHPMIKDSVEEIIFQRLQSKDITQKKVLGELAK